MTRTKIERTDQKAIDAFCEDMRTALVDVFAFRDGVGASTKEKVNNLCDVSQWLRCAVQGALIASTAVEKETRLYGIRGHDKIESLNFYRDGRKFAAFEVHTSKGVEWTAWVAVSMSEPGADMLHPSTAETRRHLEWIESKDAYHPGLFDLEMFIASD